MPSERVQRQIDGLLDEAEAAIKASDWALVRDRARNVLALDPENRDALDYLAAADRWLAEPVNSAGVPPPSAINGRPDPEGSVSLPTSFANGRYRVNRLLGEGGKKRVYLAHDTLLDRDVAFALIKTEGLDEEGRERITREAQAMGKMGTHPHIVSVFDMGLHFPLPQGENQGEGTPYLVTELMGGGDVEGLLERAEDHRLSIERALEIAQQVCRGLEFAHEHGVVHRDLKPGNVWLTADPSRTSGQVAKIGDFGLAVALDRSRLTQAGMMVGTVAYMPPEQAMGGEVTPRSDLYSLGAMLYEMVCGRPPFVGEESVAIITQHLNAPPVSPTWHRPDCPPGLEALVLRLLEKEPGKRPETASEVRQALEAATAGALREPQGTPAAPTGATDNPLYRRTFVGREKELRQLQAAFDAAVSGQGALVMVAGEPGIGKTALCEQLATYATLRGGKTLVGHCYEEGSLSMPYLAFVEAMRSYIMAREPDGLKADLGTGATDVARIVSEVRDRLQVELRPTGDPEDDRWRLLQAVSGFLRNASAVQPLLIVLEDLHWADRGTLDLLLHLCRNLQGARLLIAGTYRDVEVDRAHPLSGALADLRRIDGFQRVPLRGLTVDEVHRMMANIRGQEVPWSRAEAIHRQTEGNPLFVQEVLRYLVEEGLVVREGGRYVGADGRDPDSGIPEGLRDVIGKRLSRLSGDCNRLLAVAAVVGRDFNLETLRAVAGVDEEVMVTGLEEAVRVGVLEERSRPGRVVYRFAHAFFRQTLYEEMIAPRRLRLHQEVARALEAEYGARREEHAAELAEHFAQSTDRADLAKAVEYGKLAAERAMAVYAYAEAASHLERGLAVQEVLDPDDKPTRCDLLLALGDALIAAGEPLRAANEVAAEAFRLAEALGDEGRASAASQLALRGLRSYGAATMAGTAVWREWAQRAGRYAAPETSDRVHADIFLQRLHHARGDLAQARAFLLRAMELARRLGDPQALCAAAFEFLNGSAAPQHWEEKRRIAEEFTADAPGGVSSNTLGTILWHAGQVFLAWGERDRAEETWRRLEELGARTRIPTLSLNTLMSQATLATLDGRLEEAMNAGPRLIARADELGSPVFGRQFAGMVTTLPGIYLGRSEEVRAGWRDVDQMAGAEVESWVRNATRALLLAHVGRVAEAQALLDRYLNEYGVADEEHESGVRVLCSLQEASVLLGDRQAASDLSRRLASLASMLTDGPVPMCVARHLGAAAALLDDREQARAYYQQAIEVCTKVRHRPELALTRLQLAELLLEHYPDEKADAIEHLDFAIAEFREMKMQPSLERALKHKGFLTA